MPINPYLNFDGNTREAVEFYARALETEPPQFMTFADGGESPDYPLPAEARDRIMHTRLDVDGTPLMFSDTFPGMPPLTVGNNFSLTITGRDGEKMARRFSALAQGGEVIMPLQETSWSKMYGQVRDKYGVEWQFSLDQDVA